MIKRPWKVAAVFSILVFIILTITMFLTGFLTMLLYHAGLLDSQHRGLTIVVFALVSIIIGTVLSKFAGKRPIGFIIAISDATKEVAKGNFDIKLNEDIPATELHDMAHNFNIMTRELAGTEMLRNDFVENVSHEFKTPLSAIEGYATLLQKKALTEEKRMEYTQKILYNTKRLSSLTGNILLLSRLENQEIGITRTSYCLDEQLREIILLFEEQWTAKNLELEIDLDNADYCGNKDLLAHVWQNILSNAMKFVSEGGRIHVLLKKERGCLKISIADNGMGMSREVQQRIYEKFYQGDTSRTSQGNGLGLTLAKRIVDLHGGNITVSSKEGKGTAFMVSLPLQAD